MKTKLFLSAAALSALCMVNYHALSQTKVKSIVKKNIASLAPFDYDSYALKEIIYLSNLSAERNNLSGWEQWRQEFHILYNKCRFG